jgi:glycosyltransferase involved in cell wall biosynthesis
MLIGIDASRSVAQKRTGTENYSFNLIHHLLALGGDYRYRLYFNRPPSFPPKVGGERGGAATLRPCNPRIMPFPRLWTHLRLSWEMARRPPDLLFVPAHVLPVIHPRRSVVTVHDLGYLYYPEAHRLLDRVYLDLSTRYNARAAAHLIADSSATKRDLIERYGTDSDRITVIYPGYDAANLQPVRDKEAIESIKAKYDIFSDYILFVGTLQPRKNLPRLIRAFSNLQPLTSNLQLVIAGKKGWLYEGIFRQVEELGLTGNVVFTGYVTQEDLPALLSGARLFVFPSLYEGFGLPVLEAMACGTPVVCSNAASLPEVAGGAALLVDPLDVEGLAAALERVLGDEELRARLTQRGFEQARRFSWEKCARETLKVLENVCHELREFH